jgi:hypothetical protein
MSSIEVRPFRRSDREQVTALVNAHVAAVIPGVSVSVNTVLNQLERDAGEFIVDPWVSQRLTLVTEQRGRVVAAAHLLRYSADAHVGEYVRDAAEIHWFVFWPAAPFWPDARGAAESLLSACTDQMHRWAATHQLADGALPAPGVYGVPEQWPHIRELLTQAGFASECHTEIVYMANVAEIPRPPAPLPDLRLERSVGINGTRLSAAVGSSVIGYIEIESREDSARQPRPTGLADIGNLHVAEQYPREGVGAWLLGQAADWLTLGRFDRVLDYATLDEADRQSFLSKANFCELTRTQRGWRRKLSC